MVHSKNSVQTKVLKRYHFNRNSQLRSVM